MLERFVIAVERIAAALEAQNAAFAALTPELVQSPEPPVEEPKKKRGPKPKTEPEVSTETAPQATEPEVKAITLADLQDAGKKYILRRKDAGSSQPKDDFVALLQHFAGKGKTTEVDAADYPKVMEALTADWIEEL